MSVSYSISLESGAVWSSNGASCYGRLFKNQTPADGLSKIKEQTGDRKPVPVSVNVLVDNTSGFGQSFLKTKQADIQAYYHWLMNESAWTQCFLQRDLDSVLDDSCFKFSPEVDTTLMMSAMFVIRLPCYINGYLKLWNKVFSATGNPYLSTILAYFVNPDDHDSIRSVSVLGSSDSNMFNRSSTRAALSAFVQGNPVTDSASLLNAPFKTSLSYRTTISSLMFPDGPDVIGQVLQQVILSLDSKAKSKMVTYLNPFIGEQLESRIEQASAEKSVPSVKVPFNRLPEVLAKLV